MSTVRHSLRALLGSGCAFTATLAFCPAIAQQADSGSFTLEEVVVTAQKRTENLQDVPASVSLMTEAELDRLNATQLTDYAAYIPGFQVDSNGTPGQTRLTLRGINPMGASAAVGTYIDDSPLGSSSNFARAASFGLDLIPYEIQRIEVLRGPQGTLYGASTMGGLLKYVTRSPDLGNKELRLGAETSSIEQGDDLGWGVRASANVPLHDTFALRASYVNQHTPGYVDGPTTGSEDRNKLDQQGGRVSTLWQPRDDFSVKLSALLQDIDSDSRSAVSLTPDLRPEAGELVDSGIATPFEQRLRYYTAAVNWDLGWAEFVSATSYSRTKTDQRQDGTFFFGGLVPMLTGGAVTSGFSAPFDVVIDMKKETQEFRLVSPTGDRVEWLLGAFYTEEKSEVGQQITIVDAAQAPISSPTVVGLPLNPFVNSFSPSKYSEYAAFGDLTFKFNDTFDVTGGVRWARNKQDYRQFSGGPLTRASGAPAAAGGESDEDVVTYMVSPRIHFSENTMLYARVATGYRPGGPNAALPGIPPTVDADTLTNYEVGLKSESFGRRLLVELGIFHIDWEDIQLVVSTPRGSYGANGGKAESRGLELNTALLATQALRLGFNLAYTDATLSEDVPELDGRSGDRLPETPTWSGALTADYQFPVGARWDGSFGGGLRYVGDRYSDVESSPLALQAESYQVLDLNAGLSNDRWNVRIFARNVTDERTYLTLAIVPRPEGVVLQPRTIGISVDTKF